MGLAGEHELHGPVGQNGELVEPSMVEMSVADRVDDAHVHYSGSFTCERPGRYGYTVRVVPSHGDMVSPLTLGLVAWA